ncbi:polysaccharide biosynthesis family protein [Hyphomonas neptunium ATCC 15444]|uniref:Polysaccharide biosynthesis family protein n=2 Tax=Hyphomonas TaxID=85 RepID=Q0C1T9_HYPNA|nr:MULTISPECIES: oligosaccharide flippase family protein [Hyphomonas]ABI77162.1 polysaccharide biosynthesis family protein [Hyphomonas neptunium ATCC 15444]KCZ92611.1 polysaccharide biosynthesis family protein [Hyphomonas hirschiana VP5]
MADTALKPEGPIKRAIRNAGWLLAGKGTGGVFSLFYLALTARSLGAEEFGIFALILSYGQAVTNLAQFQSWQTVVRYGAQHEAAERPDKLLRIIVFATLLDFGAAAAGTLLAIGGVYLIGGEFGWTEGDKNLAALFCLSLLFGVRGAPTGVLRLFDRFDIAAYAETVLPTMRLLGALAAWASGASIAGYLAAWAAAEVVTTAAMWWASLREIRRKFREPVAGSPIRGVIGENEGLWAFAWTTNINTSLNLVWKQFPVLVVGWAVDAVAAGGFRIATQLVGALNKPTIALARAIYPEFAKLAVVDKSLIQRTVVRACLIGAAAGGVVLIIVLLAGKGVLELIAGEDHLFVFPILIILTVAAMFDLSGVAIEPALVALGRPGTVLRVRGITSILYAVALMWAVDVYGSLGAAVTTVGASILLLALMLGAFRKYGAR